MATESNPYPEWDVFAECASYSDNQLIISQHHLQQIHFNQDGLASFFSNGHYFYLKPDGQFLPVLTFDNGADPFQEGLVRSLKNGKVAFYNAQFEQVIPPTYDWAWPFKQGRALVCTGCSPTKSQDHHTKITGGLWGFINKDGNEVVPVHFKASEVHGQ